jgi:hypothetical protein
LCFGCACNSSRKSEREPIGESPDRIFANAFIAHYKSYWQALTSIDGFNTTKNALELAVRLKKLRSVEFARVRKSALQLEQEFKTIALDWVEAERTRLDTQIAVVIHMGNRPKNTDYYPSDEKIVLGRHDEEFERLEKVHQEWEDRTWPLVYQVRGILLAKGVEITREDVGLPPDSLDETE